MESDEKVALLWEIAGQLHEIEEQLRRKHGYPHDLETLRKRLGDLVKGKFNWPPQITYSNVIGMAPAEEFEIEVNDSAQIQAFFQTMGARVPYEKIESIRSEHNRRKGKRKETVKLFSLLPRESFEEFGQRLKGESFRLSGMREFLTFIKQHGGVCAELKAFCGEAVKYYGGMKHLTFIPSTGDFSNIPYSVLRWDIRSACLGIKVQA